MRATLACCLAFLAGAASAADAPPVPESLLREPAFESCVWGEVASARASIGAFDCSTAEKVHRLVADDAAPGFALEIGAPGATERVVVVRLFDKPADAPLEAVLEAVRAASPGPDTAGCAFVDVPGVDAAVGDVAIRGAHVELTPTGAAAAAWASANATEPQDVQPCGPLGVGSAGMRTFAAAPDAPSVVVYVDWGSEIQIFAPSTLAIAQ